jgi:hypothetical protein
MKTPMQELLDGLNNTYYKSNDVIFRDSLHFVICIIEQNYIEKEKEVMRQFGIRCIDGYYSGSISEEDFTETFFAKKFFQEDFTEFFDKTFKPTKEK